MAELNPKARINLQQARILLLDSPRAGLDIMGQLFAGFGARDVRRCESSDQAIDMVREDEFDLIVCDGDLADGQSYDFISWLRRSDLDPNRYCPVLLVTGHTPQAYVAKARDCGSNYVVVKPLSPTILLERIVWIAQNRRQFVETHDYVGQDRRFQQRGPPPETDGRRRGDMEGVSSRAATPNLSQNEIDGFMKPAKVQL